LVLGLLLCHCAQAVSVEDAPKTIPPETPKEPQSVVDAKIRYPDLFSLQTGHIEKTCSPNPGVCHNSNNYPEFRTVGNLIAAISAPCNIEMPDVTQGWDACEGPLMCWSLMVSVIPSPGRKSSAVAAGLLRSQRPQRRI